MIEGLIRDLWRAGGEFLRWIQWRLCPFGSTSSEKQILDSASISSASSNRTSPLFLKPNARGLSRVKVEVFRNESRFRDRDGRFRIDGILESLGGTYHGANPLRGFLKNGVCNV